MLTPRYALRDSVSDDAALLTYPDHVIYQTQAWLAFLAQTQRGEIVTADLVDETSACVGRFTGLVIRRLGLRVLGSPLPGWTTSYMGFNLAARASRASAMAALKRYAFGRLRCHHIEVTDRYARADDHAAGGFHVEPLTMSGYEVDLSGGPERVLAAMKPDYRQNIRRAARDGLTIEVAEDAAFADEYFAQLKDVFARKRLVPTYGVDRVRALIDHLQPTGRLLLLRARDADGDCIATGIFPAANDTMYFWGGASWRHKQHLRPNQALVWHAMLHWMSRGIIRCDMVGGGQYKTRFGAYPINVPGGRASRYAVLENLRNARRRLHRILQRSRGRLRIR